MSVVRKLTCINVIWGLNVCVCVCVCVCVFDWQVARKLVMVEGELERAEDRAEQGERCITHTHMIYTHVCVYCVYTHLCMSNSCLQLEAAAAALMDPDRPDRHIGVFLRTFRSEDPWDVKQSDGCLDFSFDTFEWIRTKQTFILYTRLIIIRPGLNLSALDTLINEGWSIDRHSPSVSPV